MPNELRSPDPNDEVGLGYLRVDDFIGNLVGARALATAFQLRLIDFLFDEQPCARDRLSQQFSGNHSGFGLLIDLLAANHVVEEKTEGLALTRSFQAVLAYRDLLEAKIDFATLVAPDVLEEFTALLCQPAEFMRRSHIFKLFSYQNCFDPRAENYARTRAWMRFTTALTRHEAEACIRRHDFGQYRRLLDIGGNSGEFVLRICKACPRLDAAVFDLPLVCDVGKDHVAAEPESSRIAFVPGNALADPLPAGFDLITFKSMLHDWPELEARRLLTRASQALSAGGALLIFERGPFQVPQGGVPFSMLPMLLFFRSFRSPDFYEAHLRAIGFPTVEVRWIDLDMPFFLLTAKLGA